MKYWVYIHTCRTTGKKYVGQTRYEVPEWRWGKNGRGYISQKKFWRAIQKYGWNDFDHDVRQCSSFEEMNRVEAELIEFYGTINNGYNVDRGGNEGPRSEEARQHMRESQQAYWSTHTRKGQGKGQKPSDETRAKLSAAKLGTKRDPEIGRKISESNKGHITTPETRAKLSKALRGRKTETFKFQNPETGEIREMTKAAVAHWHPDWIEIEN